MSIEGYWCATLVEYIGAIYFSGFGIRAKLTAKKSVGEYSLFNFLGVCIEAVLDFHTCFLGVHSEAI